MAFQGQPRFRQVVAPGDDARFFQPGKSPFELGRFGAFFQLGILVLFVFLVQLEGHRIQYRLQLGPGPFVHVHEQVLLIIPEDGLLFFQDGVDVVGLDIGFHHFRQPAHQGILPEQFVEPQVEGLRHGSLLIQTLVEHIQHRGGDAVGPEEFFEIQGHHVHHGFAAHRNRSGLFAVALRTGRPS